MISEILCLCLSGSWLGTPANVWGPDWLSSPGDGDATSVEWINEKDAPKLNILPLRQRMSWTPMSREPRWRNSALATNCQEHLKDSSLMCSDQNPAPDRSPRNTPEKGHLSVPPGGLSPLWGKGSPWMWAVSPHGAGYLQHPWRQWNPAQKPAWTDQSLVAFLLYLPPSSRAEW